MVTPDGTRCVTPELSRTFNIDYLRHNLVGATIELTKGMHQLVRIVEDDASTNKLLWRQFPFPVAKMTGLNAPTVRVSCALDYVAIPLAQYEVYGLPNSLRDYGLSIDRPGRILEAWENFWPERAAKILDLPSPRPRPAAKPAETPMPENRAPVDPKLELGLSGPPGTSGEPPVNTSDADKSLRLMVDAHIGQGKPGVESYQRTLQGLLVKEEADRIKNVEKAAKLLREQVGKARPHEPGHTAFIRLDEAVMWALKHITKPHV